MILLAGIIFCSLIYHNPIKASPGHIRDGTTAIVIDFGLRTHSGLAVSDLYRHRGRCKPSFIAVNDCKRAILFGNT